MMWLLQCYSERLVQWQGWYSGTMLQWHSVTVAGLVQCYSSAGPVCRAVTPNGWTINGVTLAEPAVTLFCECVVFVVV